MAVHQNSVSSVCQREHRTFYAPSERFMHHLHVVALRSIRKGSSLCTNPFKGFTLRSESFEGLKGVGDQTTVSWNALLRHPPMPTQRRRHHGKNQHKGSWVPKWPSVVPFEILHSEGPFEVASFEHFGLERLFNMAAMIVFTPKCPSEGDISRLERSVTFWKYEHIHESENLRQNGFTNDLHKNLFCSCFMNEAQ